MRKNTQLLSALICLSLLTVPCYASAQTAADFKTTEYYASKGLDILHAADAYALGYTGKGVLAGVSDLPINVFVPELETKTGTYDAENYPWNNPGYINYNFKGAEHGTHVAGIVVGSKDNKGMHGVAFDANLVSGMLDTDESVTYLKATYDGINQNSAIKIVNNSWGASVYIDELKEGKAPFDRFISPTIDILASSITGYDKVLVFAAGNAGHPTPGGESMLSYIRPRTAGNFLNVTIVNPANYTFATQTASTNFVTVFSDLTKYVEENSIAAPGDTIYSASAGDNGYTYMSGTSMAAPHVSGVAGLVQQAFPYMSGK